MPKCFICKQNILSFVALNLHFKVLHRLDADSKIECAEQDCIRFFSRFQSYKRHWNLEHSAQQLSAESYQPDVHVSNLVSDQPLLKRQKLSNAFDLKINKTDLQKKQKPISDFDLKHLQDVLYNEAKIYIGKLYDIPSMPRCHVQLIVHTSELFMNKGLSILRSKVLDRLICLKDNIKNVTEISNMFDALQKPFQNLETEHQRFRELETSGDLIQAENYVIGKIFQKISSKNGHVNMGSVEIQAKFFPLRKIFKKLFESSSVYDIIMNYKKKLEDETEVVSNFIQGKLWKHKMKSQEGKDVLPLFLSIDDYETGNPLGSHKGVHKLGACYISIPCFPPEYRSLLKSYYMAVLYYSADLKEFGVSSIYQKLVDELQFLQDYGIQLNLPQGEKTLFFQLGLITADNLGMHQILGFIESFNGNYACRFCKMEKSDRSYCSEINPLKRRNQENYEEDLVTNDGSLTGIKHPCVFNNLQGFHITENFSVDLMHDALEGFCGFSLVEIINYYITKTNYFTLEELNNIIVAYDYGPYCSNVPPPITFNNIKDRNLDMSASEMLTFVRHFGLMTGQFIPNDDPIWHFFILLRQLIDFLVSPVLQKNCSTLLRTLIKEHNSMFIKIFKKPLKPKNHFLLHYPEVMEASGPVVHLWTMRAESKHRPSKVTAAVSNSRRNICSTLALKHQLRLAYQFLSDSVLSETLEMGPSQDMLTMNLPLNLNQSILKQRSVLITNWIKHCGVKYQRHCVVSIGENEDDENGLPRFGIVKHIALDEKKKIFLLYNEIDLIGFDYHIYAYECIVTNDTVLDIIELNNLLNPMPTSIIKELGKSFIVFRHSL